MYRIPEDPKLSVRITWLRTTTGWEQFEDRVPWAQQVPRTPKFEVWGDRGVFVFEQWSKPKPKEPVKATPVFAQDPGVEPASLQDYEIEDTVASPEDEWASLWEETRNTNGKLTVSGGRRVGWLHDVIQTTPLCELRVT